MCNREPDGNTAYSPAKPQTLSARNVMTSFMDRFYYYDAASVYFVELTPGGVRPQRNRGRQGADAPPPPAASRKSVRLGLAPIPPTYRRRGPALSGEITPSPG